MLSGTDFVILTEREVTVLLNAKQMLSWDDDKGCSPQGKKHRQGIREQCEELFSYLRKFDRRGEE